MTSPEEKGEKDEKSKFLVSESAPSIDDFNWGRKETQEVKFYLNVIQAYFISIVRGFGVLGLLNFCVF